MQTDKPTMQEDTLKALWRKRLIDVSPNVLIHPIQRCYEQLMVVLLGCAIGTLLVAIYLPIFKLGSVIDSPTSPISWSCGYAAPPPGMQANGDDRTSLERELLPSSCLNRAIEP